jgi:hypothetical protein
MQLRLWEEVHNFPTMPSRNYKVITIASKIGSEHPIVGSIMVCVVFY